MPGVDIIVPCFNYGRFVTEAVETAFAQTVAPTDVLVIDDGSTDDTPDVLRALANGLPFRHIRQDNAGLVATLRRGIAETSSPYFVTLSADDRLAPTFIERTTAVLEHAPEKGYCYTHMRLIGDETGVLEARPFDPTWLVCAGNYIGGGALIRRAAYDRTPGFRVLPTLEDWDLWLSFLDVGLEGVLLAEPLYEWRLRPGTRNDVGAVVQNKSRRRIQRAHWRLYLRHLPRYLPHGVRHRFAGGWRHAVGMDA
jgi:glycosyltransferase involved in cell wall biosynthesis